MRRCGSIGTEDDFAAWSGYLHCGFNSAANAGRTRPTTAPYQRRFLPSCRAGRGSAVFCLWWACSALCCASWQSFAEAASKMHGTDCCAVAAAVRHLRHCAAALCHDRLCRGVQLRHRHQQHDVPGNGASAAGPVRICWAAFVRQTEKKLTNEGRTHDRSTGHRRRRGGPDGSRGRFVPAG